MPHTFRQLLAEQFRNSHYRLTAGFTRAGYGLAKQFQGYGS